MSAKKKLSCLLKIFLSHSESEGIMKKIKILITPLCVLAILIFSIAMNVFDINNPKASFFPNTDNNKNIQTKTNSLGEKLSLSLNDTRIEMKLDNVETAFVTTRDTEKNTTVKRTYFQVYATIKNTGDKSFSFNSVPVFGISSDNYIVLAKNAGSLKSGSETIVATDGIIPNQNLNLVGPFFEIKPGNEKSGYFLFEGETQNIQLISNGIPYVWQTMKQGRSVLGSEFSVDKTVVSSDNGVSFKILKQQYQTITNKDLNILYVEIANMSNTEISPFAFVPKYGVTVPGEVSTIETLNNETASKYESTALNEQTRLAPHTSHQYVIAFHQSVKYIFPQPPLVHDSSNIKIIL